MLEAPPTEVLGDTLIPVINKLQDIFSQVTLNFKLNLPQVAVIGSQSSGKSSVLEALVGRDFLPRGPEICTRRPLVLQLVKTPATASTPGKPTEWGEFLHLPGKIFTDFERIRAEISAETERVVGTNKNVSDKPIRLKICSPDVLTMTLVDLPGITKVPVGDQPSNIEARIRDMIYTHIREPTTIILAVSPANVDLANSDALQMSQMVDPDGTRTIGVITKLDIMDRGTNAVSMLRNQVIPLRLGYVGVVNRSQDDINKHRSMAEARRAEEHFYQHHPEYSEVSGQCGVGNLARRLNMILVEHIRAILPDLRKRIADAAEERVAEMRTYGDAPPTASEAARGGLLLQLLCEYSDRFSAMLEGRSEDMPTTELAGGARIRCIFQEVFARGLRELNPHRGMTDEDVRTAIKNSSGVAGALLIPQEPFELLVRRSISKLLAPCIQVKDLVYQELLKIAELACPPDLSRFPTLQRRLAAAVLEFILSGAEPADRMITDLVACEHDYINTDHPEFVGGTRAVKEVMEARELKKQQAAGKKEEQASKEPLHKSKSSNSMPEPSNRTSGSAGVPGGRMNGVPLPPAGLKALPDASPYHNHLHGHHHHHASDMDGEGGEPSSSGSGSWFSWLQKSESRSEQRDREEGVLNPSRVMQSSKPRSEHEEVQVEVIRHLVQSYFELVRKNLTDSVPKSIMHFLVNHSQRGMQQHLIRTLYKEELFEELMKEREDISSSRESCHAQLRALQAAARALEEVPQELPSALTDKRRRSQQLPGLGGGMQEGGFLPAGRPRLSAADRHPSQLMAHQLATQAVFALQPVVERVTLDGGSTSALSSRLRDTDSSSFSP